MDDDEMEEVLSDSSVGEAVSGRGQIVSDEDDGIYYIPERRPSLDLGEGSSPLHQSHWFHVDQALTPNQSYCSMISGDLHLSDENHSPTSVLLRKTDSYSSCYSLDSDDCEKRTPRVRSKDDVSELPERPELVPDPNMSRHPCLTVAFTFKAISKTLKKLSEADLKTFKGNLWKYYPESFIICPQSMDLVDLVDRLLECYDLQVSLQITKKLLDEMNKNKLVEYLQNLCRKNEVRYDLCVTLKRKYEDEYEEWGTHEEKKAMDDVYTDLYVTATSNNGPNTEHEVVRVEKLHTNRGRETLISPKDILNRDMVESLHTKLLLTTGMAGTGKSTLVRKVIMDWVEERSHQHVAFMFPLPFRELKAFERSRVSLVDVIQTLYPETKNLSEEDYNGEEGTIVLILDGLDAYKGSLDFHNTELHTNPTEAASLEVLVVNLLRGRLLYSGAIWITSRPQLRRRVPWDTHYVEIELRGFGDSEKEEYFKRRFEDPKRANRVLAHLRSCRTLHIMCHLPLFCSLLGDEFQRAFDEGGPGAELPRRITHVYTKLLLTLLRSREFGPSAGDARTEADFLVKLGKLAFNMLERGQVRILKADWKEFGLNNKEAVNSGICTQFMTEPVVLYQEEVICFLHPTVQDYMAALYVFLSFVRDGTTVFEAHGTRSRYRLSKGSPERALYKSAVERSLLCEDGRLDVFLRFLLGMTQEANQKLLQPFGTSSAKWPPVVADVVALIRKRIGDNQHPDRNGNLQSCLEELGVGGAPEAGSS